MRDVFEISEDDISESEKEEAARPPSLAQERDGAEYTLNALEHLGPFLPSGMLEEMRRQASTRLRWARELAGLQSFTFS